MCLSKVTESYDTPSEVIMSGVKFFYENGQNKLQFQTMPLGGNKDVLLDTWISADPSTAPPKGEIKADDGRMYKAGFHIFAPDQKDLKYTPKERRVYFRKVTCKGEQQGKIIYIAQEMYVPSNPDAWPPTKAEAVSPKKSLVDRVKGKITGKKEFDA